MNNQLIKRIQYAFLLSVLLFTGCSDFFDVTPDNAVKTDEYYNNTNDLNGAAYGIYAAIAPDVHKFFLWGSARGEFVLTGEGNDAYVSEFVNNNVTDLNPYTDYGFLYKAIARCNHHLTKIGNVKPSGYETADRLEVFYGETYFVRAWCYYQLVRTFGAVPLLLKDASDAITYTNEEGKVVKMNTLKVSEEELRATALLPKKEQKIWEAIISDLNKAMELLKIGSDNTYYPNFTPLAEHYVYRANLFAAYTLAADVALWTKQYERASAFASYVLTYNGGMGGGSTWYTQYTNDDASVAKTYNSFSFGYRYSGSFTTQRMQEFTSPITSDGGRYLVKPNVALLDALFNEVEDTRKKATWERVDRKDVIWKYIGKDNEGVTMRLPYQSTANWNAIKLFEAYSIKALAENRLGRHYAAFKLINQMRTSRGMLQLPESETAITLENMEQLIFEYRAREMAFEGKRWYDLLLQETVFGNTGIIARTVSKKYPKEQQSEAYNRLLQSSNWYLPIDPTRWK